MSRKPVHNILVTAISLATLGILCAPNSAEAKPFKATLTGNAHPDFSTFPVVTNEETGEGQATHLGRFKWEDDEVATFAPPDFNTFTVEGTFTMTAANGDKIHGELSTSGFINEDGNLIIHGTYQFTSGTGRFAHVAGSGQLEAVGGGGPDFPVTGTFVGTIDY